MKNNNTNMDERTASERTIDDLIGSLGVANGHYLARVLDYTLVDEQVFPSGKTLGAHVELSLLCKDGGKVHTMIFLGDHMMKFAGNLVTQSHGTVKGWPFSKMMSYFKQHDLEIWVSWDDKKNRELVNFYNKEK